jgi:hypothetical protein
MYFCKIQFGLYPSSTVDEILGATSKKQNSMHNSIKEVWVSLNSVWSFYEKEKRDNMLSKMMLLHGNQFTVFQCSFFFQRFMIKRLFHQFLSFNGRYFQLAYVSNTIFVHERGKLASRYDIVCMPGKHDCFVLHVRFCLSYCLTGVFHMITQKILYFVYSFTPMLLYNCSVDRWIIWIVKR